MTSWLSKRKKNELIELSSEAGMSVDESLKKDDLIDAIDEYLQKNSTRLAGNASFKPYFDTRRGSRPRESIAAGAISDAGEEAKSVVKRVSKKVNKVKADAEASSASFLASPGKALADIASRISSPLAARTPASRRSTLNSVVPASPAQVAENLERATTKFRADAQDLISTSGIPTAIDATRSTLSSVIGVQLSILLFEAWQLQGAVFPFRHAFYLPAIKAIGLPNIAVKLPDLFILLQSSFWGPTLLWLATSVVVPVFFAYFYNLTIHPARRGGTRVNIPRYPIDPMTYSVAKGIITLIVYGQHAPYGWIDVHSARVIEHAMYYGYSGLIANSALGAAAALWEATQR